jgi:regulator of replication initiation timing
MRKDAQNKPSFNINNLNEYLKPLYNNINDLKEQVKNLNNNNNIQKNIQNSNSNLNENLKEDYSYKPLNNKINKNNINQIKPPLKVIKIIIKKNKLLKQFLI